MHPFFTGVWDGAIGKPPQLYNGALRTAANMGFSGTEAQSRVSFHNSITWQATNLGLRYAMGNVPPADQIAEIWASVPESAKGDIKSWAWGGAGQIVGGSAVSAVASQALMRGLKLPRPIVGPAMLIVGMQGAMAAIWRDV